MQKHTSKNTSKTNHAKRLVEATRETDATPRSRLVEATRETDAAVV